MGARTALVMLFVAALAVLGLGLLALVRNDAPETDGWLRYLFGRAFAVVGFAMAVVLGIAVRIGLWSMAGATAPGNVPALSPTVRQALPALAIGTTAITATVALTTGRGPLILDLGLIGTVALATLGLAGAVRFSPHRGRAILSAITLGTRFGRARSGCCSRRSSSARPRHARRRLAPTTRARVCPTGR